MIRFVRNLKLEAVHCTDTGGLILKSFSLQLKSPNMSAKSLPWASFLLVDSAQGSDLAPIFGDLSQIEKLSEINPPLKA